MLATETISIEARALYNPNNNDKEVVFKNCAPLNDWIKEIKNTQVYNGKDIDLVKPMYNLIEYSNNYPTFSVNLWQYQRSEVFLDVNDSIANFSPTNNDSASFKFKEKITCKAADGGTKDVEIIMLLKDLSRS